MPIGFFLFILAPLIELAVLIKMGYIIGVMPTIALLVLSAITGMILLKQQGLSTLLKARKKLVSGQVPTKEVLESIIIALCGCLMILPGFITDIVGLCGLFPSVRRLLIHRVTQKANMKIHGRTIEGEKAEEAFGHSISKSCNIIEEEVEKDYKSPEKKYEKK